jgi:septal ring factor EnvC (AmiA/AmiB activator)
VLSEVIDRKGLRYNADARLGAMDSNLTTAIVSACATALVAIVAIVNNNKRLDDVHKRLDDTNTRLGRVETKLDTIEHMLASYALDVARIKEKLGIA